MSAYPKVAGLDIDLTKAGLVIVNGKEPISCFFLKGMNSKLGNEMERIVYITKKAIEKLKENNVKYVAVESESYQSRGRYKITKARLTGIICYLLYINGFNVFEFSPNTIKKFIHKGNASKEEMEFYVKLNFGVTFSKNDITDAYSSSQLCLGLVYFLAKNKVPKYFTTKCSVELRNIYNNETYKKYYNQGRHNG